MTQDLRFAIRLIVKERWYALVAVVAVALGIGVNATGFAIVNGAFLRGPAFRDSGRLLMLSWQGLGEGRANFSYPELQDWRSQSRTFAAIGAFSERTMNISDDRTTPEQVEGALLTANAFGVLGQPLLIGRDFTSAEDQKTAQPVAILGYKLWKNRYGGDESVLGMRLRVDGKPATIIGVMPDKMMFPINAELWIPFVPTPLQEQRGTRALTAFGRLRDGATVREAQAEMNGIAQQFATAYPDLNKNLRGVRIETITDRFVGGAARVVFIAIMGAAGFVLAIACANVANLLLSRSTRRSREIAVRISLGASRGRVLRQLLLESVVLAAIGGIVGVFLAVGGTQALDAALTDPGKPYWIAFNIDFTVLAYTAAVCVLTGILFGLAPALQVSNANLNEIMNQSGRGNTRTRRARWFSSTMVEVELALTVVLLVGAGLMIRSFFKLYSQDVGIQTDQLMSMRLVLPASKYPAPAARLAFFEQLRPRLAAIPGVESAAVTSAVPPFATEQRPIAVEGTPPLGVGEMPRNAGVVTISPEFFTAVGAPLRRGRTFGETDGAPGSENVIINERMAVMFFPGKDPVGRHLRFKENEPWRTIVGISPSIRHSGTRDGALNPVVYVPVRENPPNGSSLILRSSLPPATVMASVRRAVQEIDPDQPVFTIETMDQILAQTRWAIRTFGSVFVVFGAIALALSSVGLYAVMAYAVTQRTQEIGVRIALGANGREVSWMILKRGLAQLVIGLAIGLAGAIALGGVLQRALIQVSPTDPATFVSITIVLTTVAIAACLIPARRATRVDPLIALRGDGSA